MSEVLVVHESLLEGSTHNKGGFGLSTGLGVVVSVLVIRTNTF